jgi:membrane protease YdiL (CAAX protease family)
VAFLHSLFEQSLKPELPAAISGIIIDLETIIGFILMVLAYRLYTRYIENRQAHELTFKSSLPEIGLGIIIGGGLMILIVSILAISGSYRIAAIDSDWTVLINNIIPLGMAAFIEEMVFRIIIFKLTEELAGSWVAIVIQAGLFGLAHIGNENATLWAAAALAIEAGIILAAAYMYSRRIWMAFGIHLGWNYFQAYVFGITTSGTSVEGLIKPQIIGSEWLTGGEFGVEKSVVAVILCLITGIIIFRMAVARNQYVLSIWARKKLNESRLNNTDGLPANPPD